MACMETCIPPKHVRVWPCMENGIAALWQNLPGWMKNSPIPSEYEGIGELS